MRIGLVAEQSKREMMANFAIAYKLLLGKHDLYAPEGTARCVKQAAGLKVVQYLPGEMGGISQLMSQIERDELDALIYFYSPGTDMGFDIVSHSSMFHDILNSCDEYCIPVATNLGSAEVLIMGISNGDLDWRL